MTNRQIKDCPLCAKSSEFMLVDHQNRKHFFCAHCSEFQVSNGAESRLSSVTKERRVELSALARQGNEEGILVITLPAPSQGQEGFAGPSLVTEFVARAKLPQ